MDEAAAVQRRSLQRRSLQRRRDLLPAGPLGQDWICKLWGLKRTTGCRNGTRQPADIGTCCMASCGGNFQRPRLRCTLCLCTMHQSYWFGYRNGSGGCYVKTSPNDLFIYVIPSF